MQTDKQDAGPSPPLLAWRRFVVESALCVVLLVMIVVVTLQRGESLFAGPLIALMVGAILHIVAR